MFSLILKGVIRGEFLSPEKGIFSSAGELDGRP